MKILKAGKIIVRVLEIISIIGIVLCLGMTVMSFANPQWLMENGTLTVNNIEISQPLENMATPSLPMAVIFLTGAIAIALEALMLHRLYGIIVETMKGKPFQPCTVKWMKEIGYCAFITPLVGSVMSIVAMLVSVDGIHATLDVSGLLMGVLVLCLTHVFAYGLELQKDVDGLL